MSNFLYPGQGNKLRRTANQSGNVLSVPETTVIPDNGFSESIAAHDCLELMLNLGFAAATAVGKEIEIHISPTADFTAFNIHEKVVTSEVACLNWTAGQYLSGFFRVKNTSGQNLTVTVQKRIL